MKLIYVGTTKLYIEFSFQDDSDFDLVTNWLDRFTTNTFPVTNIRLTILRMFNP